MKDQENNKDHSRHSWENNHRSKPEISEEQRFLNKAKKQFKKQKEETRADEAWEEWEDYNK
jgi:hypothetical protein